MDDLYNQYKEVKTLLGEDRDLKLTDEDNLRLQDILGLLEERGYIRNFQVDGMNWYRKLAEWDDFEVWLKLQIKESHRLSRGEWMIGIVCAVVGAAVGLIPYIVSLFSAN